MHKLAALLSGSALVVKEVQIDENAEVQVHIIARKSGLISWIFSLFGIDPTYTLWVYKDRIETKRQSLSGGIKSVVPISSLDSYTYGFTRPFLFLWLSIILFVIGFPTILFGIGILFIILAIILLIKFILGKCLTMCFTTYGGNIVLFLYKRSVIEGVSIDENLADKISEIVKQNYIVQTTKRN